MGAQNPDHDKHKKANETINKALEQKRKEKQDGNGK